MYGADKADRWKGAAGAAVLVGAIGYGLVAGLTVPLAQRIAAELHVVALLPQAPPPKRAPVPAAKRARKRKQGAASPPNLTAHATQIVAPPVVLPPPPPVTVAPVAGLGSAATQGAAPVVGPGTGSGGTGTGFGSGAGGDGDGGRGDGDGGSEIPLELLHGTLRYKDLPRALIDADAHGTVEMHFIVAATGRVSDCRVTHGSGNRELDMATCALIKAKLRYRPTRDARGRARADYVDGEQEWTSDRRVEDDTGEQKTNSLRSP